MGRMNGVWKERVGGERSRENLYCFSGVEGHQQRKEWADRCVQFVTQLRELAVSACIYVGRGSRLLTAVHITL